MSDLIQWSKLPDGTHVHDMRAGCMFQGKHVSHVRIVPDADGNTWNLVLRDLTTAKTLIVRHPAGEVFRWNSAEGAMLWFEEALVSESKTRSEPLLDSLPWFVNLILLDAAQIHNGTQRNGPFTSAERAEHFAGLAMSSGAFRRASIMKGEP